MAEINTRIILRNDTAENWEKSTLKLKGGEAAVEVVNGKAKLKIATADDQTFENAPYIGGAEANVFQVELAADATDIEGAINAVIPEGVELAIGDIAIVKAEIASGKTSYTSYVYSEVEDGNGGTKLAWAAMDGNYNASNVYFSDDLTLAGSYTSVGNVSKGSNSATGTLSAKGKSLTDVMTSIFTKEINTNLQNTNPSTTINATKDVYLLVGANSTEQTVTLSLGKGSYDNGYGYVSEKNETGIAAGTPAKTVVTNDGTGVEVNQYYFNGTAQAGNSYTVASTKKTTAPSSEIIKGKISYKNAGSPVSNLKNIYPAQKLANGTTAETSATLNRWYLPFYHGFTVDSDVIATPEAVTAAQIQGLKTANMTTYRFSDDAATVKDSDRPATTTFTNSNAYNKKKINTATASGSWRQYFLAYPKDWGYTMTEAKDSNNLTCGVSEAADVTMTFNGVNVVYKVYYINNKAAYDTTKILWTI